MAKRRRSANFTAFERSLLITTVFKYKNVIENRHTNSISMKEKTECWKKIANEFNLQNNSLYRRDTVSLKKCWDNWKKTARKRIQTYNILNTENRNKKEIYYRIPANYKQLDKCVMNTTSDLNDSSKCITREKEDCTNGNIPGLLEETSNLTEDTTSLENNLSLPDLTRMTMEVHKIVKHSEERSIPENVISMKMQNDNSDDISVSDTQFQAVDQSVSDVLSKLEPDIEWHCNETDDECNKELPISSEAQNSESIRKRFDGEPSELTEQLNRKRIELIDELISNAQTEARMREVLFTEQIKQERLKSRILQLRYQRLKRNSRKNIMKM